MIFVNVAGDREVAAAFDRAGSWIRERLKRAVRAEGERLKEGVKQKLSGPNTPRRRKGPLTVGSVIASRSGKLREKVVARAYGFDDSSSTDVAVGSGGSSFGVSVFSEATNRGYRYGFALGTGFRRQQIDVRRVRDRTLDIRERYKLTTKTGKTFERSRIKVRGYRGGYKRYHELVRRPFTTSVLLAAAPEITSRLQAAVNQVSVELQAQVSGAQGGEGI